MSNSNLGAGKEVLSYCSKCKLTLAHIIVSMKDVVTIGKVECKTCHAVHAYKDPLAAKSKSRTGRVGVLKRGASKAEMNSNVWEAAMNDQGRKHHPYSVASKFSLGDIIAHPKFGPGVVERMLDDNKIEVIFKGDVKTLIHNS